MLGSEPCRVPAYVLPFLLQLCEPGSLPPDGVRNQLLRVMQRELGGKNKKKNGGCQMLVLARRAHGVGGLNPSFVKHDTSHALSIKRRMTWSMQPHQPGNSGGGCDICLFLVYTIQRCITIVSLPHSVTM
ncbi:hypothetical protein KCU61_g330, partial [Aureobasidium melanogenum]